MLTTTQPCGSCPMELICYPPPSLEHDSVSLASTFLPAGVILWHQHELAWWWLHKAAHLVGCRSLPGPSLQAVFPCN